LGSVSAGGIGTQKSDVTQSGGGPRASTRFKSPSSGKVDSPACGAIAFEELITATASASTAAAQIANVIAPSHHGIHIISALPCGQQKRQNPGRVKCSATTLALLAVLSSSLALAEDFKTINGKLYKDATISRVEADGIVLRTKTGISKVYFIELPKDIQERFHPSRSPSPTKTVAAQREREPIKLKGWAAVMANPIAFIVILVAGTIIIAGVVFVIVRSCFQ